MANKMNELISRELIQKKKVILFLQKEIDRFITHLEKNELDDQDLQKLLYSHISSLFASISAIYNEMEEIFEKLAETPHIKVEDDKEYI